MNTRQILERLEKVALYIGAFVVLLMILHTTADIVTRNFMNSPIEGTYEITVNWYMVAIAAVGLWAAAVKNDHIEVTIFSSRLQDEPARIWRISANLITIAALAMLAWFGFETAMARMASGEYTGAAEITIWQARFFLPIGFSAFAAVVLLRTLKESVPRTVVADQETEDTNDK